MGAYWSMRKSKYSILTFQFNGIFLSSLIDNELKVANELHSLGHKNETNDFDLLILIRSFCFVHFSSFSVDEKKISGLKRFFLISLEKMA